ncbi:MAG: hypothetical protein M1812_001276 [Candelaria pacifica]|nr:MAG: hypothetical protein M1812_001276 [Candelaria pacifica]
MAIASFLAGSLPLTFSLSQSQLRLVSTVGMGVLVGTSLIVIIPEGVETLYSASASRGVSRRDITYDKATDVRWMIHERYSAQPDSGMLHGETDRRHPSDADLEAFNSLPGPVIPENSLPSADSPPMAVPQGHHAVEASQLPTKDKGDGSHNHPAEPHAWVGLSLILGFILMYLIDQVPQYASTHTQNTQQPYHISLDNLSQGLHRSSSPDDHTQHDDINTSSSITLKSRSRATTTGLVIHAAADGIALGASSSTADERLGFVIFFAIMVHKAPAAFGLTSVLLKQGLSKRVARGHLVIFSLAAPFGALATWMIVHLLGKGTMGGSEGTKFWTGVLLLFSAGTFLYVAMHTMQEESQGHDELPNGYTDGQLGTTHRRREPRLRDTVAAIVGMLLPLVTQTPTPSPVWAGREQREYHDLRGLALVASMVTKDSLNISIAQRRASLNHLEDNETSPTSRSTAMPMATSSFQLARAKGSISQSHPQPLPTPSRPAASSMAHSLIPSAPASPPTPAPSPTPHQRVPSWSTAGADEDSYLRNARSHFSELNGAARQRYLAEILNLCNSQQLSFVHSFVSPRLKKDPFDGILPIELCLRVLAFVDDPKTLARASQVSKTWHGILSDELTWKVLCEKHAYRRLSDDTSESVLGLTSLPRMIGGSPTNKVPQPPNISKGSHEGTFAGPSSSAPDLSTQGLDLGLNPRLPRRPPAALSYKSHFKQRYMVETAWKHGGRAICRHITPDQGVVTSLHLTPKYIVVALDNAKIHVFNTDGNLQKTLLGHVMGVWAMVPWGDILVSGGCDRDVRVWNMDTGQSIHTLRGHTSTVRCLKMSDANTAISGSRDTTLRVWDITTGVCKNILVGHSASVRCLEIHGDIVVSGSYDTSARIWSISDGKCLKILSGHYSQIYAIAFDGKKIATGSLDTSVRIWDPQTGICNAVLQGHTSLVGQLQMRGDTLVTGGSDGSVRVWSLKANAPIHRLAAHDNSVTSLQFDDFRVVSGGSDGRVKVWDLKTGQLVRELSSPAEAVWRVAFEEDKAVIMAMRATKTIMEVWSFSPPDDDLTEQHRSESPVSLPDQAMMDYQNETDDGPQYLDDADMPVPNDEESHVDTNEGFRSSKDPLAE